MLFRDRILEAAMSARPGTSLAGTVLEGTRGSPAVPRLTRRLSDKVLVAFHHACDTADLEVAEHLVRVLELMLSRRAVIGDGNRRRNMESLVAAHERLWHLRHPETLD